MGKGNLRKALLKQERKEVLELRLADIFSAIVTAKKKFSPPEKSYNIDPLISYVRKQMRLAYETGERTHAYEAIYSERKRIAREVKRLRKSTLMSFVTPNYNRAINDVLSLIE